MLARTRACEDRGAETLVQGRGRRSGQQVVARGSSGRGRRRQAATGGRAGALAPLTEPGLGEGAAAGWAVAVILGGLAGMAAGEERDCNWGSARVCGEGRRCAV